jgi:HEPN domain-containing protein
VAYSAQDGYSVEDMLHFGYGHVDAARELFQRDAAFLDSAGYLAQLGVELVLKAWHLEWFGNFDNTHNLVALFDALKKKDKALDIGPDNEKFLTTLNEFYELRYPRREKGPVEVGSDQLKHLDALLHALWEKMPEELTRAYEKIDGTQKGGRRLMKKAISKDKPPGGGTPAI